MSKVQDTRTAEEKEAANVRGRFNSAVSGLFQSVNYHRPEDTTERIETLLETLLPWAVDNVQNLNPDSRLGKVLTVLERQFPNVK